MFSKKAWQSASPIYKEILDLPFIKELSDGSLEKEKFIFYMHQDLIYLVEVARNLSICANPSSCDKAMAKLLKFNGALVAE